MRKTSLAVRRNSILTLVALITVASLFSCRRDLQKISIKGTTKGLDGYVVSLKLKDSTITGENIANGQFNIIKNIPREDFYTLQLHSNNGEESDKEFQVYLTEGEYNIDIDSSSLDRYPRINADSPVQKDLTAYYLIQDKNSIEFQKSYNVIKQTYDTESQNLDPAGFKKISEDFVNAEAKLSGNIAYSKNEFIAQHPESVVSAYFLSISEQDIEYAPAKYLEKYEKLGTEAKESRYGEIAKKLIDRYMKGAPNTVLPDISGTMPDGSNFDKKVLKGKISLVMFWMSSNRDSREDIEKLTGIYKELHSKGFEIVGIAFDTSKERFQNYVSKNKLPWIQVYDAEWTKSPNIQNFGNSNLPYYFLVGPDLKIIERNPPLESIAIYHKEYLAAKEGRHPN